MHYIECCKEECKNTIYTCACDKCEETKYSPKIAVIVPSTKTTDVKGYDELHR